MHIIFANIDLPYVGLCWCEGEIKLLVFLLKYRALCSGCVILYFLFLFFFEESKSSLVKFEKLEAPFFRFTTLRYLFLPTCLEIFHRLKRLLKHMFLQMELGGFRNWPTICVTID